MKPEIKKTLVHALRSGEYKQGFFGLRSEDCFCVLGVLCNLHAQAHPEVAAKQECAFEYMGKECFLPETVMEWAGIASDEGPDVIIDEYKTSLMCHNDAGVTFEQLANAIEEQL